MTQTSFKESKMVTKLLRSDEIAQLLGVSKSFAYKLIRLGLLPSIHLGRSVRVRQEDLDTFIITNIQGSNSLIEKGIQ
jgi:excisionase family DNA binding protein